MTQNCLQTHRHHTGQMEKRPKRSFVPVENDGYIKITIKEADDADLNPVDKKEDDIHSNPYSQYKMPTF